MASRGLNKVVLIGFLGGDPEIKYTPQGTAIANFSVATSESWKDKDGKQQDRTEWHRIVAWQKLAEIIGEYAKKGQQVFVEGKLQTRSWEKDGQKHYATEIVAQTFQILGRKSEGGSGAPDIPLPDESSAPPPKATDEQLPF